MAAKLVSEAFLPSGAIEPDMAMPLDVGLAYTTTNGRSILHHSHGYRPAHDALQPRGRIPPASTLPLSPTHDSNSLSPTSRLAARGPYTSLLSTQLRAEAASSNPIDRCASPSPSRKSAAPGTAPDRPLPPSSAAPLSQADADPHVRGPALSRSVSADAVGPSQTSLHIVQRLVQQNALIREAWEAERNHLEANRRRAEEVYQEERIIMDEVRDSWQAEKSDLLREIETLKARVHRLEGENSTLKTVMSPLASQRGGSDDASAENSILASPPGNANARSTLPPSASSLDATSLPPGLDGASRRPHFLGPGSARVSPSTQPESSPFIPLDPRMQPQHSTARDFLSSPFDDSETPVPIIDVKEIDPKLEGIPIKATAVQRSTFSLGSSPPENPSSPTSSAPSVEDMPVRSRLETGPKRLSGARSSSKMCTLQALAAAESRRLTMHAGHTPNHSLSLLPTVDATETNSLRGQSEGATPTVEPTDPDAGDSDDACEADETAVQLEQPGPEPDLTEDSADHPEPLLDAVDDAPLKGPLMIRNMPAQDEIFWEALNRKLEPISQGQNALPAAVQASADHLEPIPEATASDKPALAAAVDVTGGDGSNDAQGDTVAGEPDDSADNRKSVEPDVPLKIKSTTNFGAPFGVV